MDFVDAISYLLKLQTDQVILDGHDQACPDMPKEVFETYISEKLLEFQTWFLGSHLKVLEKNTCDNNNRDLKH